MQLVLQAVQAQPVLFLQRVHEDVRGQHLPACTIRTHRLGLHAFVNLLPGIVEGRVAYREVKPIVRQFDVDQLQRPKLLTFALFSWEMVSGWALIDMHQFRSKVKH